MLNVEQFGTVIRTDVALAAKGLLMFVQFLVIFPEAA